MKCINLVVHLMLCASVLLYEGNANAQTPFFNKTDARKICENKTDTLLSYKDITENTAKVLLLEERLDDKETIWIEDYAEYSRFISYVGCYNGAQGLLKTKEKLISSSGLFMCLKTCTKTENQYIGVLSTHCYCIRDNDFFKMQKFVTNDQYCDISREGLFNKTYDPNYGTNMTVYEILPQQHLDNITVGYNKSQSVYTKIVSSQKMEYRTGTCSMNFYIFSFLCTQSAYHCRKNNSCQTQTFDIQQRAKSLLQAELLCQENFGILHKIPINTHFAQNYKMYLTGSFRVFAIRERTSVCLSVRKSVEGLIIEPGDCSINKSSFCHTDLYTATTSDSKSQFPDEVSTTDYIDSTTITNLDKNNDNNQTTLYIIIILSVECIVVAVTIYFLHRHFKVRNTTAKTIAVLTPETSAVNLQPNQTDNTSEHEYSIPSIHNEDDLEQVTIAVLTPETSAVYLLPNQTDYTSEHEYSIPSIHNEDDLEQVTIAVLTPETSAVYFLPNQTDNTSEHEYAIPSIHNEDDLKQVTIPKKPQRKALHKSAPDSAYENFVFGVASNKTEKCEHENNYVELI